MPAPRAVPSLVVALALVTIFLASSEAGDTPDAVVPEAADASVVPLELSQEVKKAKKSWMPKMPVESKSQSNQEYGHSMKHLMHYLKTSYPGTSGKVRAGMAASYIRQKEVMPYDEYFKELMKNFAATHKNGLAEFKKKYPKKWKGRESTWDRAEKWVDKQEKVVDKEEKKEAKKHKGESILHYDERTMKEDE